jgi:hypothetical protein
VVGYHAGEALLVKVLTFIRSVPLMIVVIQDLLAKVGKDALALVRFGCLVM